MVATAMMFSACKKDDDKNEEPEVTPTPVVINDDDLDKFDISNSQFCVTETTTSSISVEWKEDEVKFDSVKIELKRLVVSVNDSSFVSVTKTTVNNDTKYTFDGLETSQKFDIQFSFYSNKKICKRSYKAISEDSDKMLIDGSFNILEVGEVVGMKILLLKALDDYNFSNELNCYGGNMVKFKEGKELFSEITNAAYGYHVITNSEFEKIELAAGATEEDLLNAKFEEFYSPIAFNNIEDGELFENLKVGMLEFYPYLDNDYTVCCRYFCSEGICRYKDVFQTLPGLNPFIKLLFVHD